jgi:hypothetical protein
MQIDADASMKMEDEGRRIRRGNTPHLPSTEKTRKKKKQEEYREETRRDSPNNVFIHFHPNQSGIEENSEIVDRYIPHCRVMWVIVHPPYSLLVSFSIRILFLPNRLPFSPLHLIFLEVILFPLQRQLLSWTEKLRPHFPLAFL